MPIRTRAIGAWLLACASAAAAGNAPFTGVFMGGGRACYGGLFVRTKTVEWNTPFNRCKRTRYDLLERMLAPGHERITMKLKNPSCAFQVIALEQTQEWGWTAYGYQTVEAYEKRELPDWKNSPIESRMVLTCSVDRLEN